MLKPGAISATDLFQRAAEMVPVSPRGSPSKAEWAPPASATDSLTQPIRHPEIIATGTAGPGMPPDITTKECLK
jgi:hypothetical protein